MALAAPAEKDGFYYAGDSLYREASTLNRHRRATIPELKAHFTGKDTENNNRPAHWYEAQLLHYGLPPSKVKGTAHKRLFDAVTKGGLTVPSHIQKLEADLKKEWTKREREAKKMSQGSAAAPKAKPGTKRKADQASTSTNVSVNVSVQISSTGKVIGQSAQPATKKAKTAPAKSTPTAATSKAKKTTAPQTTRKTTTPKKTAAPQTARKTITPKAPKPATKPAPPTKPAKPTTKGKTMPTQTARRSNPPGSRPAPAFAMGRGPSFDDAPPPYAEFDTAGRGSSSQAPQWSSPHRPTLGLLNGRYTVRSRDLEDQFHEYNDDFGLVATLDGNRLWIKFDFGAATGIMELGRPWSVTDGKLNTIWRGHALDEYGDRVSVDQGTDEENWVEFLGDGYAQGSISWDDEDRAYRFEAERLPDQPMRSEISPFEMRGLYDGYDQ